MANIQHAVLTDPQIHEPKGVSTAASGKVYRANGSGSGVWVFPSGHAYGEIYIAAGVTTQTLPAASATAKLNPTGEWTTNGSANVTLSAANGQITVLEAGEYQLNFWVSFTTASAAAQAKYNFHYAVNGIPSARKMVVAKYTNGADTLHCAATGFASLAANDIVSIYVGGDGTTSSTAITVLEAGLSLSLIDPA
ncbi:hypothetical protein UFOVP337_5 [uncultured Caudovirales phage]|uniref:Uncharacterized protein n=1 Tax=uncultured Caudovirales phage TaxID=2100421 RepID=A0A6J5LXW8_9CAUD|nr:hypothetical protein UFOVP337_5 [uncultured Caudovirales phage]